MGCPSSVAWKEQNKEIDRCATVPPTKIFGVIQRQGILYLVQKKIVANFTNPPRSSHVSSTCIFYTKDEINHQLSTKEVEMSANTPVANRWSKRFPFALIILAVGLILSYLLIIPLPALTRSAAIIRNEISVVSNEAVQIQRGWDAYAARYTTMAKQYAVRNNSNQRGLEADASRYTAMAEAYTAMEAAGIQRAINAYAARYTAMAEAFTAVFNVSQHNLEADAAHYNAMVKAFAAKEAANIQRSWDAYAARYTAMANRFTASNDSIQRGMEAYTARHTAMAEAFAAKEAANIQRGWDACAARYTAMANHFTASNESTQRGLEAYAARYTAMAKAFAAKEAANIQRSWDTYGARYTAMAAAHANMQASK